MRELGRGKPTLHPLRRRQVAREHRIGGQALRAPQEPAGAHFVAIGDDLDAVDAHGLRQIGRFDLDRAEIAVVIPVRADDDS